MDKQDRRRIHPVSMLGLFTVLAAIPALAGCADQAPAPLLVATGRPLAERRRLEAEFHAWTESQEDRATPKARIRWLVVDAQTDLKALAKREEMPDVLLGGIPEAHLWLADQGLVRPDQSERAGPRSPFEHTTTGFDDPRTVPVSLDFALSRLGLGRWSQGYAELVRVAGGQHSALASGVSSGPAAVPLCASILQASRTEIGALQFLRFLAETQGARTIAPRSAGAETLDPLVESLIADLLGAALVDARDELETAWSALARAGYPAQALKWMNEPPSWPPASVARYLSREGQTGMALVQTLAHEVAPDPAARAWLVRSWLSPPRLVDDTLLAEITQAAGGRLGREPRFRAWLNAEWTASARQRYRRVARLAAGLEAAAPQG